ncbi:hypothetical protein [Caballeronia insecticola]|nr:hypothetical protein [Caballeronia insecticola]
MQLEKDSIQGSVNREADFAFRRKFLAALVASAGSAVLAACGGGGDGGVADSVADRQRRRGGSTGASGSTAASSPAASAPATSTPASTPSSTNNSSSGSTAGVLTDTSFGVKGDGKTNDRAALQAAIDGSVGQILLITGQCRIDTKGLDLRNKSHIRFAPGASIKLLPYNTDNYEMIRAWDVDGAIIENAYLDGSKELNSTKTGELGMGISICGATNLTLESPTTINCWGDGIYIDGSFLGGTSWAKNITINNHHAVGCRRQGMSVISVSGLTLNSPIWESIGGTAPGAGLDIEPYNNIGVLENITINSPTTKNCAGPGIQIWLSDFAGNVKKTMIVNITNHVDTGSKVCAYSVQSLPNGSNVTGSITSTNPVWGRPLAQAYYHANWDPAGPKCTVVNPK